MSIMSCRHFLIPSAVPVTAKANFIRNLKLTWDSMAAHAPDTIMCGSHSPISSFLSLSSVDMLSPRLIPLHQPPHLACQSLPHYKGSGAPSDKGKDHFRLHCAVDLQYLLQC